MQIRTLMILYGGGTKILFDSTKTKVDHVVLHEHPQSITPKEPPQLIEKYISEKKEKKKFFRGFWGTVWHNTLDI